MRKLLLATTVLLGLAAVTPANAITIGGVEWDLSQAATLTLTPVVPGGNQPRNLPCIICGANQPQQPTGFGYNLFGNQGNDTTLPYFSTSVVGGSLGPDQFGGLDSGYTLGANSPFQGQLGGNLNFSIGIDSNQAGTSSQVLESFWFLNFTTHTVLAVFSPGPGGSPIDPPNNGTGFPDYTLDGFTLAGINPGDRIGFFARITGANDGPDSFFLVPQPTAAVPELSTWMMMILGFVGVGGLAMRKRKEDGGGFRFA
jgi:hypothetical protein